MPRDAIEASWKLETQEAARQRELENFRRYVQRSGGLSPAPQPPRPPQPWETPGEGGRPPQPTATPPPTGAEAVAAFRQHVNASLATLSPPTPSISTAPTIGASRPTGGTTATLPAESFPTAERNPQQEENAAALRARRQQGAPSLEAIEGLQDLRDVPQRWRDEGPPEAVQQAGEAIGQAVQPVTSLPPVQKALDLLGQYQRGVVEPLSGAITMAADEGGKVLRGDVDQGAMAQQLRERRQQPALSREEIGHGWERMGEEYRQWEEPAPGVKFGLEAAVDLTNLLPLGPGAKAVGRGAKAVARELGEEAGVRALEAQPAFARQARKAAAGEAAEAAPAAAAATPPPTAAAATAERAGNIMLEKFPEELRPTIQKAWENAPERMEAARRGVVGDDEVRRLADEVGLTPGQIVQRWKPGKAANAETLLAMRTALGDKTRQVLQYQRAVRETGDSTENLARLALAVQEHAALQEAVHGVTAEAGRALRQYRQALPQTSDAAALAKALEKLGGRQKAEALAEKLGQLDMDNPVAVAKFIRGATQPKGADYLVEWWYNSILSAPPTHIVNTLSNTLTTALAPAERALAAGVEAGLSRVQRRPAERFFGEVPAELVGALRGLPEGARKALFMLRQGYGMEDLAKLEFRRTEAFKGRLGAAINVPSRMLGAADALFRSVNYSGTLHSEAYRAASREGLKGQARLTRMAELLASPTPELMERAGQMAAYRVYQQPMGRFTQAIARAREGELWGLPVGKFIVPFLQTPVNVTKYGLERSPLGLLNPALYRALRSGSADASDMLGRAIGGSLLAGAIAAYAWEGKITGRAPTKPNERDAFFRQGKQEFSIKVGDKWVKYQRLEPLNQPLAQVAALADASKRRGTEPPATLVMDVALTIGRNLVSQTYLSGLADVLDALEDPERHGGRLLERTGASLALPYSAASRTVARTLDPTIREPRGFGEALKANIPGLSRDVPARLDAMGQEVKRETPAWSPVEVSSVKQDKLEDELQRLGVTVGSVGDKIGSNKLSREQAKRYQADAGQLARAGLSALVASDYYGQLDDTAKAKAAESVIDRMHRMARESQAETLPGGKRQGLPSRDVAALRGQAEAYVQAWSEYNALPRYRGMDWEESERAYQARQKVLAIAREKRTTEATARRYLDDIDPDAAELAYRASKAGTNPDRRQFLKDHPELRALLEPEDVE